MDTQEINSDFGNEAVDVIHPTPINSNDDEVDDYNEDGHDVFRPIGEPLLESTAQSISTTNVRKLSTVPPKRVNGGSRTGTLFPTLMLPD